MRPKWGKEEIAYLLKPIPKVERNYFWEWASIISIVVVILTVIHTVMKIILGGN